MRGERLETSGIITAGSLYKGLVDSGISSNVASYLYDHEKAHADADKEGRGDFGFYISTGYIVAYYLIKGERTPEQLMEIASAPGFSQMSMQDWKIYNAAWGDWLNQAKENEVDNGGLEKGLAHDELKIMILDKLAEKLDDKVENCEFPGIQDLLSYEFIELVRQYGDEIYSAYYGAIEETKKSADFR